MTLVWWLQYLIDLRLLLYTWCCVLQQNVIKELEGRVQQLMNETENVKKSRAQLEKDKCEAESRNERFKSELRTQQDKYVLVVCVEHFLYW